MTALAAAVVALIVTGVIGGLGWIKPEPQSISTQQPPQIIYIQPPPVSQTLQEAAPEKPPTTE